MTTSLVVTGTTEKINSLIERTNVSPSKLCMKGKGTVWKTLNKTFGKNITVGEVISIIGNESQLQKEMIERHEGFEINVR